MKTQIQCKNTSLNGKRQKDIIYNILTEVGFVSTVIDFLIKNNIKSASSEARFVGAKLSEVYISLHQTHQHQTHPRMHFFRNIFLLTVTPIVIDLFTGDTAIFSVHNFSLICQPNFFHQGFNLGLCKMPSNIYSVKSLAGRKGLNMITVKCLVCVGGKGSQQLVFGYTHTHSSSITQGGPN